VESVEGTELVGKWLPRVKRDPEVVVEWEFKSNALREIFTSAILSLSGGISNGLEFIVFDRK
jgi:hypothetical protein